MTLEERRKVERIFAEACDVDPSERAEYLDEACGDNQAVRQDVESLLRAEGELLALEREHSEDSKDGEGPEIAPQESSEETVPVEELSHVHGAPPHPEPIGPYRILEALGEGGMGEVYLAEQSRPVRRRVALKLIKLGMNTKEVVARFESERQALALMQHPNIATVFDAGSTSDGRPYFVMEYVRGEPFSQYCDRHRLTTRERLELFLPVCEAVQHAHQKAVIHRDLKPSNVLVMVQDGKPMPKIIDFGIAKATNQRLTESTYYTEQGRIIGTPEYMSPEQAEMTALDVDTRTDTYSLGVMLYELLTGTLPFDPKELRKAGYVEIQRMIREVEPPKPSTRLGTHGGETKKAAEKRRTEPRLLIGQLKGDLDWITMKAMEKDRVRRYANVSELAADIRRHLDHEPVLAARPSLRYRLGKFARKRKVGLLFSGSALLLLAVMTVAIWAVLAGRVYNERLRRTRAAFDRGTRLAKDYIELKGTLGGLESEWESARRKHAREDTVWEREDEIAAWDALLQARKEAERCFSEGVVAFSQARELAPDTEWKRTATKELESLYWERYLEARQKGGVTLPPDYFRLMIEDLGLGTYAERIEGSGRVALDSGPPGADAYCFRYEEKEKRLVPLPFDRVSGREDPRAGIVGRPFLEVEKIWKPHKGNPFEPGDRLLTVRGQEVLLLGQLATALRDIEADVEVRVEILRSGEKVTQDWIPFSSEVYTSSTDLPYKPGELQSPWHQLGLTFSGYPLEFRPESKVGSTPLSFTLPAGSYLLVLRKEGYRDTRYPVVISGDDKAPEKLRLLREEEIPPGFAYIPQGPVAYGGDTEAYQSLPHGKKHLKGFFLSRFEVTLAEYAEFLKDVRENIIVGKGGTEGYVTPMTDAVRRELPGRAQGKFVLVASAYGWRRDEEGVWHFSKRLSGGDPVFGVSRLAAMEYAAWRTRRDPKGFRYRLPSDLEWEKAARGVDRRPYVWGRYLVRNFCWSHLGMYEGLPNLVGVSPFDESLFGVRDLAGSVEESTDGRPAKLDTAYRSVRGANWYDAADDYYFRIATRNGRYPDATNRKAGIRLAADLLPAN